MKRRTILIQSNYSLSFTGFGRMMKCLFKYLHQTGKYNLIHYCSGLQYSNSELQKTPWLSVGCLPDDPRELEQIQRDPNLARLAAYGNYYQDRVMQEFKPDIFMACEDHWGLDFSIEKYWFNKIPSILHVTIDSLPLLEKAVQDVPKVKEYWVWSKFAEKAFHKLGHTHVKTVHGPIDTTSFYRLSDLERNKLREKFNISKDTFVVLDVFRSQLRKLVPNLLEGYKIFKKENPLVKSALLLHTSTQEGWSIPVLMNEFKIDKSEVLFSYICRACREYRVKPFTKHEEDCEYCGNKSSQITVNCGFGLSEEKLNEVYNLADVFVAARTSGSQEYPLVEAKLAEIITLVTDYSFGETFNEPEAASLPLDYAEYREIGTQFIKSSTYPSSIAKQLNKVYRMSPEDRRKMGKQAREWAIKNYSIDIIGKKLEKFFDNVELTNFDFVQPVIELKNPNAQIPQIDDNTVWIKTLYKEILKMDVKDDDQGLAHWKNALAQGMKRPEIENYFRGVAQTENNKGQTNKTVSIQDLLIKNDKKHLLLVAKEAIGDLILITSLLKSWRETYPRDSWNIYFACDPQFFSVFDGNEYIDKMLPYQQFFESEIQCTGRGTTKGLFDSYCNICLATQKYLNYLTQNNINLDLEYASS